jgi:hypothetical protein
MNDLATRQVATKLAPQLGKLAADSPGPVEGAD